MKNNRGFTLIEVLLALVIIAIAVTALLKVTAQNIYNTERIKEKSIKHWIAMQAISSLQLGLIPTRLNQEITQTTPMLGKTWYWRAKFAGTPIKPMQQITITVSQNQAGPFTDPLIGYRYAHE